MNIRTGNRCGVFKTVKNLHYMKRPVAFLLKCCEKQFTGQNSYAYSQISQGLLFCLIVLSLPKYRHTKSRKYFSLSVHKPEAVPQQGGTHQAEEKMLLMTSGGNRVTFLWTWSKFSTRARKTPTENNMTPRITRLVVLQYRAKSVRRPGKYPGIYPIPKTWSSESVSMLKQCNDTRHKHTQIYVQYEQG